MQQQPRQRQPARLAARQSQPALAQPAPQPQTAPQAAAPQAAIPLPGAAAAIPLPGGAADPFADYDSGDYSSREESTRVVALSSLPTAAFRAE